MKHKDNLTDLLETLPKEEAEDAFTENTQVLNDNGELVTLGQQAVDKFLKDRKNKGK